MRRNTEIPNDIATSLRSENPVSRGTAIFELASGGYYAPELVGQLANDGEPFMFGTPVLAVANAYLKLTSGTKYTGPLQRSVDAIAENMADEWGKGTLLSGE